MTSVLLAGWALSGWGRGSWGEGIHCNVLRRGREPEMKEAGLK